MDASHASLVSLSAVFAGVLACAGMAFAQDASGRGDPPPVEMTVVPSETDIPQEDAIRKARSILIDMGVSVGKQRSIVLVFSNLNVRREWRVHYPEAAISLESTSGKPVSIIVFNEMGGSGLGVSEETGVRIPHEKAIIMATGFAKKFGEELDANRVQVTYSDVADIVPGDAFGAVYLVSQKRSVDGVICLDSFVSFGIRASDGSLASFGKGYDPPLLTDVDVKMDRERAIECIEMSKFGDLVAVDRGGERVFMHPILHGIPGQRIPFLCWVFDGVLRKDERAVRMFVETRSGIVHMERNR